MKTIKQYLSVWLRLIQLISSQWLFLLLAVLFGAAGHIIATLIATLAARSAVQLTNATAYSLNNIAYWLIGLAFLRALLKYLEQLCNHQVAFKTLSLIRDAVFKQLRRLAPAKMEGRNKGELIANLTADIELLEVFYAHTISPILIALLHTLCCVVLLSRYHWQYSALLGVSHLVLALVVPALTTRMARDIGKTQRAALSQLNSQILDSFIGIATCIQFNFGKKRYDEIRQESAKLSKTTKRLNQIQANNQALSTALILLTNVAFLALGAQLYLKGVVNLAGVIIPVVLASASYGPVTALSNLANDLLLTYASGQRILGLFDETPVVINNDDGIDLDFATMSGEQINFYYGAERVLKNESFNVKRGQILGISGKSGAGKSTLLKLMMRFYDPNAGNITMNGVALPAIKTRSLRKNIAYMTQQTHLISGTVIDNLRLAKRDASLKEIRTACQKASIDDFFMRLPNQYHSEIANVEAMLSTGEMQRLSLARVFLHNADLILLDEPTANIDSLNEAIILKSLWDASHDKAIVIVSHRPSALKIAHDIMSVNREEAS